MTATTITNPSNPRAVNLFDVAPSGDERSRFSSLRSPEGMSVASPSQGIAAAYNTLLQHFVERATPLAPPTKTVKLRFASRNTATGQVQVVERGEVTAIPTFKCETPVKFQKLPRHINSPSAILDSFFLGEREGAFGLVRDDALFDALAELIELEQPSATTIRRWNDDLCVAILIRAGIANVSQQHLPNPGTPHTPESER